MKDRYKMRKLTLQAAPESDSDWELIAILNKFISENGRIVS